MPSWICVGKTQYLWPKCSVNILPFLKKFSKDRAKISEDCRLTEANFGPANLNDIFAMRQKTSRIILKNDNFLRLRLAWCLGLGDSFQRSRAACIPRKTHPLTTARLLGFVQKAETRECGSGKQRRETRASVKAKAASKRFTTDARESAPAAALQYPLAAVSLILLHFKQFKSSAAIFSISRRRRSRPCTAWSVPV